MNTTAFRNSPPSFKRSKVLEEALNTGKQLEGIKGYVPSKVECCSGSTTMYIPVKVKQVKLGDCSFSVIVESNANEAYQYQREEFSINPKNFFKDIQEAKDYEAHLEVCRKFKLTTEPFRYSNSTLTRCRNLFREALEKTTPEIREEILAETSGPDEGVKKAPKHWLEEWYKIMMVQKFWPNAGPEEDEEEDDDSDWDD